MTGMAGLERLYGCYLSYLVGLGKELRGSAPSDNSNTAVLRSNELPKRPVYDWT